MPPNCFAQRVGIFIYTSRVSINQYNSKYIKAVLKQMKFLADFQHISTYKIILSSTKANEGWAVVEKC